MTGPGKPQPPRWRGADASDPALVLTKAANSQRKEDTMASLT